MAEEAAARRDRAREPAEERAAPSGKEPIFSRISLLVLIVVVVLEAALLSGVYVLIFRRPKAPAVGGSSESSTGQESARIVTASLGDFLVSVPFGPTGKEHKYLMFRMSVRVADGGAEGTAAVVKEISEEVQDILRDQVLSILGQKEYIELQNPDSRPRIKEELKTVLNQRYYELKGRKNLITDVYFPEWDIR